MAGESLFKELEIEAFRAGITPRTKQSIEWFRNKAEEMFRGRVIRRDSILEDEVLKQTKKPIDRVSGPIGKMYMYFYDPKFKKTLPYYDRFPLIIMLGPAKGGFYGANLHYLSPVVRARLLDGILGNGKGIPQKYIKPTIHHYLYKHVRSAYAEVDKPEWEIATFMPTAQFKGASLSKVYRDSKRKLVA